MPTELVDRAQFATVTSRLLFKDVYNLTQTEIKNDVDRYWKHLKALNNYRIMKYISDPFMTEIRSYVWMMQQRIDKILRKEYGWISSLFYENAKAAITKDNMGI